MRIGEKLKAAQFKHNTTQQSLAEADEISMSTVKKIESDEMKSFGILLWIMLILDKLYH